MFTSHDHCSYCGLPAQIFKVRTNPAGSEMYMYDYQDGTFFKEHPLFSRNPHALQLIAYYDDVGSYRGKHTLGNLIQ